MACFGTLVTSTLQRSSLKRASRSHAKPGLCPPPSPPKTNEQTAAEGHQFPLWGLSLRGPGYNFVFFLSLWVSRDRFWSTLGVPLSSFCVFWGVLGIGYPWAFLFVPLGQFVYISSALLAFFGAPVGGSLGRLLCLLASSQAIFPDILQNSSEHDL